MSVLFSSPVLSFEESKDLVDSVEWFHRVEPISGLIAPGWVGGDSYDAAGYVDSLGLGDVRGLRILEIGTWDGPVSYELFLRGADVVATDIQDPSKTGFNVLGKIGGIDVPYHRASVYDLDQIFDHEFDVVLFFGVFYHLKYPVLAFEAISNILKPGGKIFCEGSGLPTRLQTDDGRDVEDSEGLVATLDKLDELNVPVCLTYPGSYIGGDNWHLPNRSSLRGWLTGAGFEIQGEVWRNSERRVGATAVKTSAARIEHRLTGEAGGFVRRTS